MNGKASVWASFYDDVHQSHFPGDHETDSQSREEYRKDWEKALLQAQLGCRKIGGLRPPGSSRMLSGSRGLRSMTER